ncbi:MAG: DUF4124 domain-containing protein [Candidatus Competibacteraceae bacterium]
MLKRIVLALLLPVCSVSAYAGGAVYKWVDEQGNVQYRDTPPPAGASYQIIQRPPAGQVPQTTISEPPKKPEAADKVRQAQPSQPETTSAEDLEARRATVCKQAQANLEILTKSSHPIRTEADGTEIVLTEAQRQEEIKKNQKYVQEYCKQP